MLTRVALIGENDKRLESLASALAEKGVDVARPTAGEALPSGTCAVVSEGADPEAVAAAALSAGAWSEEIIDLLAEAIDCREGFFVGSSKRLKDHATRFAQTLGLSANDGFILERSACIRDIGKIRIPNQVLLKEGVLTYDEWVLLQQHPEIGAAITERSGGLKDTADVVRSHHECFDGDGYPRGLEGERIPFLARALKIIDVYCAMTSPRHYREGHSSHAEAIEYLRSERGKHYDPTLVDCFIDKEVGQPDVAEADAPESDIAPSTPHE